MRIVPRKKKRRRRRKKASQKILMMNPRAHSLGEYILLWNFWGKTLP